jgi:hypothetical protein
MRDMGTRCIWALEVEVDGTGLGSCPFVDFDISSVEILGYTVKELIINKIQITNN